MSTPATTDTIPDIACICGSMRFEAEMRMVAEHESLVGRIVLMPHVNMKRGCGWLSEDASVQDTEWAKARLDALHREKIRLATRVIVVTDTAGYIGESTRAEIAYAQTLGKPVTYWSWQTEAPAPGTRDTAPFCAATIPTPHGDVLCGEDALPGSANCRLHQHPDLP